jgi:hypothetical protein
LGGRSGAFFAAKKVIIQVEVAGKRFYKEISPTQLEDAKFIWDGFDASGNKDKGNVKAKVKIGYEYDLVYYSAGSQWGQAWNQVNTQPTTIRGRSSIIMWKDEIIDIQVEPTLTPSNAIAKGWSLSNHHLHAFGLIVKGDGGSLEKQALLEKDLVGYYRFEDNAKDSSGYNNHGILYGDTRYVEGVDGKAVFFNNLNNNSTL